MPPKGTTKPKPATGAGVNKARKEPKTPNTPSTPTRELQDTTLESLETPTKVKPKARPKSKSTLSPEKLFKAMESERDTDGHLLGDAAPIDVSYENDTMLAVSANAGNYSQHVRFRAPQPFSLVKSVLFTQGDYAGFQAIILAPAKPFRFMELPDAIRKKVYQEYLVPTNNEKGIIAFCATPDGVKAKLYGQEAMNRLALLEVNRQILEEARPILYKLTLKFDTCSSLLNFLSTAGDRVRACITAVILLKWDAKLAMPALNVLAESKHSLVRVRIVDGFGKNQIPEKAAKAFLSDARIFLQTVGKAKGHPHAGFELISWGAGCFTVKDGTDMRSYDEGEKEEFDDAVKSKLK